MELEWLNSRLPDLKRIQIARMKGIWREMRSPKLKYINFDGLHEKMAQNNVLLSKTGSRFMPAEKLQSRRVKMSNLISWASIRGIARILYREIGRFRGLWALLKGGVWDALFSRPKWHPEYFDMKNATDEKHYKKIFKSMVPLITIFEHLKKKHGDSRANEIVAKMAVPIAMPFFLKTIHPIDDLEDIDQARQMLSDYLGSGIGFEWEEKVSEDKTEVRYRFTKCVYGEIISAYGLKEFAVYSCLADHVLFDNIVPNVIFGREHTLTLEDGYCDHRLRIRRDETDEIEEVDYGDCHRIHGGRELVQEWAENFKKNEGHFKY